jgi:signal transduction histidine kinase
LSLEVEQAGYIIDVTVTDNGPGIPALERGKVAQRFYRLEPSRNMPASGLGLSLVDVIADIQQARIILEYNVPGLKTTLRFKLQAVQLRNSSYYGCPVPPGEVFALPRTYTI